ncbi:MAG: NAD(P)H-dependent oxidoreductase [Candidatus Omnitrophota bacterium]|jgi:nitrite reductase/ring-hydroxylating ferredoxin subunit/multimeric flavodoxin WrbA
MKSKWIDLGSVSALKKKQLQHMVVENTPIALVYKKGKFTAVSGECNHKKGPLGKGRMEGDYIVCPWHGWHFHRETGHGHHPFEASHLPCYEVKKKNGHLFINLKPLNKRAEYPHPKHPLEREIKRKKGPIRVLGISTTPIPTWHKRYSTSESLLGAALKSAKAKMQADTKMIKVRELKFKHCGGFYSIHEKACTWPCTYTESDEKDQMDRLYEALVFWADVVIVATPIRWGSASSLYYKMAERLNCIENQLLINNKKLIKNKVASFIITGGQDNVQLVAGQMMMFFSQLGFHFPQFPFVGHSRGWTAEDMENNTEYVKNSKELKKNVRELAERSVLAAKKLLRQKNT